MPSLTKGGRVTMAQIMNAQVFDPRRAADRVPFFLVLATTRKQ